MYHHDNWVVPTTRNQSICQHIYPQIFKKSNPGRPGNHPGKKKHYKSYDQKMVWQKIYDTSERKYNDAVHNTVFLGSNIEQKRIHLYTAASCQPRISITQSNMLKSFWWSNEQGKHAIHRIAFMFADFDDRTYFNIACMQIHHHPLLQTMCYQCDPIQWSTWPGSPTH